MIRALTAPVKRLTDRRLQELRQGAGFRRQNGYLQRLIGRLAAGVDNGGSLKVSPPFANLLGSYQWPDAERTPNREPAWPWPPWLPLSWERSEDFFAALSAEADLVFGGAAKSQLGIGLDWYADAVQRHLPRAARNPVLRWYDETTGWQSLTMGQLDAQATALAALLAARGAKAKDRIALILPSGAPLAVGLLATLRLGGCAVPVLPLGSGYVQDFLAASKPKWTITCSPYTALRGLLEYKPLLLSAALLARAGAAPPTATYAPEEPLLLVQSPLRAAGTLTPVTAGDAYAAALRDGLLILGLRPGDTLLSPPTPQHLPVTLLTALLCGARHVELSLQAARADAPALVREPARAVLLTNELRDALAARPAGPARWGRWFRDPQEVLDPKAWELAEQALLLSAIPHANLIWDAAAGGAVLVSALRRGRLHPQVAPAPGCRHLMGAPNAKGPALTAAGRVVLLGSDNEPTGSPGETMVLRTGSGYLYAGSAVPRRAGWDYPAQSAVAVLQESAAALGLVGAAVVAISGGGAYSQALFVLVLFSGAAPVAGVDSQACVALLRHELGPAADPDRVEVFPLYPRRIGSDPFGPIDTAWVSAQYVSGELHRKNRTPLFGTLTRMRAAVLSSGEVLST